MIMPLTHFMPASDCKGCRTLADFCRRTADFLSGSNRVKNLSGHQLVAHKPIFLSRLTSLRLGAGTFKITMVPILLT